MRPPSGATRPLEGVPVEGVGCLSKGSGVDPKSTPEPFESCRILGLPPIEEAANSSPTRVAPLFLRDTFRAHRGKALLTGRKRPPHELTVKARTGVTLPISFRASRNPSIFRSEGKELDSQGKGRGAKRFLGDDLSAKPTSPAPSRPAGAGLPGCRRPSRCHRRCPRRRGCRPY